MQVILTSGIEEMAWPGLRCGRKDQKAKGSGMRAREALGVNQCMGGERRIIMH